MTTPSGVTVEAVRPDGTKVDVTEGVQALYDLVVGSMDWGSGFISLEEALPVAHIARVCGFEGIEEAERYVGSAEVQEAQRLEREEALRARIAEQAKRQKWST